MKKHLFKLAMLCCVMLYALEGYGVTTFTTSITLTAGNRVELKPSNYGYSASQYRCCIPESYSASSDEMLIESINSYNSINGTNAIYNYYAVTPLKRGNYSVTYQSNYDTGNYTSIVYITFNIKVVDVISISLPSTLSLVKDDTYTFNPVIVDSEAQTTLSWSTSDASVVSVSNGKVTALKEGTALITCVSSNGVSAQCNVTVSPKRVTSISLNHQEYEIEQNQTLQLETTILPTDAPNQEVTWNSSNTSVAMVSASGKVVALAEGWTNITASTTDGSNLSASCLIHVVPPTILATSLTFDSANMELVQGDNATLTPTLLPANVSTKALEWTSSDESIATVDAEGAVTAIKIGNAVITATTTDGTALSASCNVRVKSKSVDEFENVVYFNDATVLKNSSTTLALQLKNSADITAVQFDLALPEGMTLAQNAAGTAYDITFEEERADATTHTLSSALQEDGTCVCSVTRRPTNSSLAMKERCSISPSL